MERTKIEGFPPPPGIVNSLKAGFDAIAAHIHAIFLPILLNLFFWLGPRLRVDAFFDSIREDMYSIWRTSGAPAAQIQTMIDEYEKFMEFLPRVNFFWFARTLPIGVSSLIFPETNGATPLGDPMVLQMNAYNLVVWLLLITLIGWVVGGLY